jgi:hypothetical protein
MATATAAAASTLAVFRWIRDAMFAMFSLLMVFACTSRGPLSVRQRGGC